MIQTYFWIQKFISVFYIKIDQFKYASNGQIPVGSGDGGGNYIDDYTVTFQRIHKNGMQFNKLALCIPGIHYDTATLWESSSQLVLFDYKDLNKTGFVIQATIQKVSRLYFVQCRYLAVNIMDPSMFYFQKGSYRNPINLEYNSTYIYQPYSIRDPINQYQVLILLRGLKITILSSTNGQYRFGLDISFINSTHIKIYLWGINSYLYQIHYTILFIKNILFISNPSSSTPNIKLILFNKYYCCSDTPCQIYKVSTKLLPITVISNNYFFGISYSYSTNYIAYQIYNNANIMTNNKISAFHVDFYINGIIFILIQCPQGFYYSLNYECFSCGTKCSQCNSSQCFQCKKNYIFDDDLINCKIQPTLIPQSFYDCVFIEQQSDGSFICKACDVTRKISLISETQGCACRAHYFMNLTSNACQQICGDGIKIESQCDDNNTNNNDGCDSQCKLQPGFKCDIVQNPTQCNSTQELVYKIKSIIKTDDNDQPSGVIVLRPFYNDLPFDVIKNNFYTDNTILSQIQLKLVMNDTSSSSSSSEVLKDLEFDLLKVENNEIWLLFHYNFTVEGMTAQIMLNYSETRYLNKTQILNFTLKAENDAFKISELQAAYDTVSNNVIVTVVLSMTGLLIGLFVPKFIGLEMIITMQLIFYSQLLIYDFEKWPVGFVQFNNLKAATGYNEFLNLTEYTPMTVVSKKYHKLTLHKTLIENFNLNFIVLIVFVAVFYLTVFLRSNQEDKMKEFVRENKIINSWQNTELTQMSKKHKKLTKINDILYWVSSQLSLWCVLPLLSTLGAEFMIPNNTVKVNDDAFTLMWLRLRPSEFLVTFSVIVSIMFNHFRNMFLSVRTVRKIKERPEELLYKKLLFVYLIVMGLLVFLYNDVKIHIIPMSVVCLTVHTFYITLLIIIKPYKQALRIHSVTLYFNQFLYFVFLVVINLINLIDVIDDFLVLCFGYFVIGCVYLLILLTVIRLYYEIRYGEGQEKTIQAEKQQQQKEQKTRKEEKMKKKAEKMIDESQRIRDLNKFLIENQMKETEQINLLEWLEHKNWEQQTKEKYFYNKHTEKPLQWMRKKDKAEYEKRVNAMKAAEDEALSKKKKKEEDPEYIDLMNRMRHNLEEKKHKKKTQKIMKKQKQKNNYENFSFNQ